MRRLPGTVALALLALAGPAGVTGQVITPAGSDRAGKAARADAPPIDPAPAPGARPLAGQAPLDPVAIDLAAAPARRPSAPVIGTHQIDRFDAIQKEQAVVAADPKALADWVILGELAQEVAMDVPADMADKYFRMSRDAFEKALALAPGNPGLTAAVRFARDQAASVQAFETSRDAATDTFLAARRRDLAAMKHTPSVRVVNAMPPLPDRELPRAVPPAAGANRGGRPAPATLAAAGAQAAADVKTDPAVNSAEPPAVAPGTAVPVAEASPAVTPAREKAPSSDAANYGTQQNYSARGPMLTPPYGMPIAYQPFATPDGPPYTYQDYSRAYFPPGLYDNPAVPPVTVQRLSPAAPAVRIAPNAFEQQILDKAAAPRP